MAKYRTIPELKSVMIGTHNSVDELRADIRSVGCLLTDPAEEVMDQDEFQLAEQEREVEIVITTPGGLGFTSPVDYCLIVGRAREMGLEFCPAELAAQLRLAYIKQPYGEWLKVVHKPIYDSRGIPRMLGVERFVAGRSLRAYCADFDITSEMELVFAKSSNFNFDSSPHQEGVGISF